MTTNKCERCGYEWKSRDENKVPTQCPRCKRYDYQVKKSERNINKCERCGYEWKSRGNKVPVSCARCKRFDYQIKKKEAAQNATKN